jgi:hypothetical protein
MIHRAIGKYGVESAQNQEIGSMEIADLRNKNAAVVLAHLGARTNHVGNHAHNYRNNDKNLRSANIIYSLLWKTPQLNCITYTHHCGNSS